MVPSTIPPKWQWQTLERVCSAHKQARQDTWSFQGAWKYIAVISPIAISFSQLTYIHTLHRYCRLEQNSGYSQTVSQERQLHDIETLWWFKRQSEFGRKSSLDRSVPEVEI